MTRHVLCMSSQVAFGPVGNTAAVPALQAAGFTALQVPTIILSNHPGHGKPAGLRLPAAQMDEILAKLASLHLLSEFSAVMTGYFADAEQVRVAASHIKSLQREHPDAVVLVDPVMGDGSDLYVPHDVAAAIRDELLPLASCITPNHFELAWLTGQPVTTRAEAAAASRSLGIVEVLATSIPVDEERMATLAVCGDEIHEVVTRRRPSVPNGTGDFLAGLYLACRLNGYGAPQALTLSQALVDQAISRSVGQTWLDVVGALHDH